MIPLRPIVAVALMILLASPTAAQNQQSYIQNYFAGKAIQFAYGSGVSSNLPRVELLIHYCASGTFFSWGRSCRPNIIAKGYQCTNLRDAGRWQVVPQGERAVLQWLSQNGGRGSAMILVRTDGVVVDTRGNPFHRIGQAQCQ